MLVVTLILLVLVLVVGLAVVGMRESSIEADCMNRLRQVNSAFTNYYGEYRSYPVFTPPLGLGDLHNWGDKWSHTDLGGTFFSTQESDIPGVLVGNKTHAPRLPRLLESFAGDINVLHCPSQGATNFWFDVGPYYYNTTSPFGGQNSQWTPRAGVRGAKVVAALAGCQNPLESLSYMNSWRHGKRKPGHEKGINHQLYVGGTVEKYFNPKNWQLQQ